MGGYVAWQFATKHVTRLRALIVCDTKAAADTPEAADKRIETAIKVEQEGMNVLAEAMLPKFYTAGELKSEPDFVRETRDMILRTNPFGAAAASRGMGVRPDMTSHLASITVPTLVLCGEHDAIAPPKEMQSIAAAMPRATYAEIPGAGHMAPLQSPAATNAAITSFLANL
jgi:pimeloyl-ACP methyl ester carboxylesterase